MSPITFLQWARNHLFIVAVTHRFPSSVANCVTGGKTPSANTVALLQPSDKGLSQVDVLCILCNIGAIRQRVASSSESQLTETLHNYSHKSQRKVAVNTERLTRPRWSRFMAACWDCFSNQIVRLVALSLVCSLYLSANWPQATVWHERHEHRLFC